MTRLSFISLIFINFLVLLDLFDNKWYYSAVPHLQYMSDCEYNLSRFILSSDDVRKYRSSFMGFAILWVMLFHALLDWPIINRGYLGVDIFFFLSSIGLCYSFDKNPDLKFFFKKRFVRIMPTWWLAMSGGLFLGALFLHRAHPSDIGELLLCFSGIGYWVQGAFDPPFMVVFYEWYVPTLLLFYLLFPFLNKCKTFILLILLLLWEVVVWYCSAKNAVHIPHYIEVLSLPRFSVFLYGIIYYRCCLVSSCAKNWLILPLVVISVILAFCGCSKIHYYALLLLPVFLKMLTVVIRTLRLSMILSFFGAFSFELYMVHMHWNIHEFSIGSVTITRYISLLPQILCCVVAALVLRVCTRKIQCIVIGLMQQVCEMFSKGQSKI